MHEYFIDENVIHFITTNIDQRFKLFENDVFCQFVWDEMFFYSKAYQIELLAFVIMPEHFDCLIWPKGKKTFSDYIRGVKSHSAKLILEHIDKRGPLTQPAGILKHNSEYPNKKISKQVQKIWQPGFFTYLINTSEKLEEKFEYIISNPVKSGLVHNSKEYQWLYINLRYLEIE